MATAGIWRPVYLQGWDVAKIDRVIPSVKLAQDGSAELDLNLHFVENPSDSIKLIAELIDPVTHEKIIQKTTDPSEKIFFRIPDAKLWWPLGYGEAHLYSLSITVSNSSGEVLDRWQEKIGLRTTELDETDDEHGSAFTIKVNGKKVFCKGANWIPDDAFPSRVDESRYRERLIQATDANLNMIRVWGGGIYESEEFYELCDEMGILVWQDFMFACAAYPEEQPFDRLVAEEVEYNVKRLARHPSLVLWNGNNECFWGYEDWGWEAAIKPKTRGWGKNFYLKLMPDVISQLDPSRPYNPGSPYSKVDDIPSTEESVGCIHYWEQWNGKDWLTYRDHAPRFASEFGFQAPPTRNTLATAIPFEKFNSEKFNTYSKNVLHHQRAENGNKKTRRSN